MYVTPPENIIDQARALMPVSTMHLLRRPLTDHEARVVAERQAMLLLRLLEITKPSVEVELITELPDIEAVVAKDMPESGAADWKDSHWLVRINASESLWRCRATLAHELKHILDDPYTEILYPGVDPRLYHAPQAEPICDYFAGCLLVPRPWLTRAWANGTHDVHELAALFDVSSTLITVRLKQVGLLPGRDDALGRWNGYQRRRQEQPRAPARVARQGVDV